MPEPIENAAVTVPSQPEPEPPLKKKLPIIGGLAAVVLMVGISNAHFGGSRPQAPRSTLPQRPAAPSSQQVSSFQNMQALQATRDQAERDRQAQTMAQMQALQAQQAVPGPESDAAAPMTPAQRDAIYGNSPNAPKTTSNVSQVNAEAKQRQLAREKQHQDALNSDTVAIDFARGGETATKAAAPAQMPGTASSEGDTAQGDDLAQVVPALQSRPGTSATGVAASAAMTKDAMSRYDFDKYDGHLYRVFEGTFFEGIVTNHIDGGLNGPILVMLTTDYYSHDHQQLLLPQGTRLIGTVQSVGSAQQRKLFVTFQRAVCPDGFSLELAKYIGLDPLGTTGLATDVNHGYLSTFAAAAAIGGLGGLSQVGNNGSVLQSSTEIRNGITSQTSQESEQILNRFLNRLPIITLREGSRARVYIGADLLIPSYAQHRVDPAL